MSDSTATPAMDPDTMWDRTVAQRLELVDLLASLDPDDWDRPSLCEGWRVRDVAAHVASAPQITLPVMLRLVPSILRHGMDGMILRDGRRRGERPTGEILDELRTWAPVRRGPFGVPPTEPLIDALVHTRDVARPLGREVPTPVDAAVVAADRCRKLAKGLGSREAVGAVTMRATDTDWERGTGPVVEAPIEELLMLCAGRPARWERCTGVGVGRLRASSP